MSTVRANNYYDASGGSNAQLYGVASPPNSMGFRNRIINGDMRIDQRNAGASVSVGAGTYVVDRFQFYRSNGGTATAQRSTVAPAGFTNSLLTTVGTADTSVASGDIFDVSQNIEGFNVADLGFGASGAQTITVSFWVRSSATGIFCCAIRNAALNRAYIREYTISAANTWQYVTVSFPGDTTGTWATDNTGGILLSWTLMAGSSFQTTANTWSAGNFTATSNQTNLMANSGATFYITGVQLEAGTVASAFERRDYGRELIMCQRYYEKSYDIGTVPGTATAIGINCSTMVGGLTNTPAIGSFIAYKVTKRAIPTMSLWDTAGNSGRATRDNFGVSDQNNVTAATQNTGDSSTQVYVNSGNAASGMRVHWVASAEL